MIQIALKSQRAAIDAHEKKNWNVKGKLEIILIIYLVFSNRKQGNKYK
jgi:hypothetical protein